MEAKDLKIGQWIFVESEVHKYIGVIANAGTLDRPNPYFAGVSESGGTIAIAFEYLSKFKFFVIKELINEKL